jgi:hypothetical protein
MARRIPREDTPTMLTPLAARYQGRDGGRVLSV